MDAFNFIHFLKNPAHLHQVTYQEINNLIEQYPFCQNLHYLALRKAQYENHKDFVKKLELAATYSPNRKWLYKQLQDTQVAISDEMVLTEEEPILATEDAEVGLASSAPEITTEEATEAIVSTPVFYREAELETSELPEETIDPVIDEDIETLNNEISGGAPPSDEYMESDLIEESNSEHFETTDTDNTTSHSVSDSDDVPTAIDTTDELDVNLENPEDMKLPDYKDRKVIFMEDLVDEVPPLEESQDIIELTEEEFNNNATNGFSESFEEEQNLEEESVAVSDLEEEESATPDIPFEVYDARELQEEEEEANVVFDEIPSEAEAPETDPISDEDQQTEEEAEEELEHENDEDPDFILNGDTAHLEDSDTQQQLDQPAYPSDSVENKPFAAMVNDDDEIHSNNQEIEEEDEELEEDLTEELSDEGSQEESKPVGPMPKSAFSSWRKNKTITSSPLKEKKVKKKKSKAAKVVEVADLFKKEKKKKKKNKNSKKKNTKRDAMQSLLEHEDVISETLAEIVAEQGRKKKAIKMYRRLIKMHPEKEAIYLDRIEELKKMDK